MSRNNAQKLASLAEQPIESQQPRIKRQGYTVPTDFVALPSEGKLYPEGHPLHNKKEIEIKYMTTKEEDILTSPSYNNKGIVFDKLIESLSLANIKADSLLIGDKNAILINARTNAYGETYSVMIPCTQCFEVQQLDINLKELKIKKIDPLINFTEKGTFLVELPNTKALVEVQLLSGEDEKEVAQRADQKAKHNLPEEVVTDRYRQMIVSVDNNEDVLAINQFITSMPIADSRYLSKKYGEISPDIEFTYSNECTTCSNVNKGVLPVTGDFFWPEQ